VAERFELAGGGGKKIRLAGEKQGSGVLRLRGGEPVAIHG